MTAKPLTMTAVQTAFDTLENEIAGSSLLTVAAKDSTEMGAFLPQFVEAGLGVHAHDDMIMQRDRLPKTLAEFAGRMRQVAKDTQETIGNPDSSSIVLTNSTAVNITAAKKFIVAATEKALQAAAKVQEEPLPPIGRAR